MPTRLLEGARRDREAGPRTQWKQTNEHNFTHVPMNLTHHRNPYRAASPGAPAIALSVAAALWALVGMSARADMYHPATNSPGGVQAQSSITSVTAAGTNT